MKRTELFTSDAQRKHITFHDLRATGITWAAVRGDDPLRIKQRAGHAGFATTEIYIREAENLREGFGKVFPALPPVLTGVRLGQRLGQKAHLHADFSANTGGATGDRTPDLCIANAALSQLSYCPKYDIAGHPIETRPATRGPGRYAGPFRCQGDLLGPAARPSRALYRYPSTSDRASRPHPSIATKSSSLNGRLTCVGLIICIPSARSTFETTRSMTRNGR